MSSISCLDLDAVPNIASSSVPPRHREQPGKCSIPSSSTGDLRFASDLDPASEGQVGAFVTIQKGCDNKCTFCIVPTTRGPEVSRPSAQILEEVRGLAERG